MEEDVPEKLVSAERPKITSSHGRCNTADVEIKSQNNCFLEGQSRLDAGEYDKARACFEKCQAESPEARYQLAVLMFDGLGGPVENERSIALIKSLIDVSGKDHLAACAAYNLGRAYYEGYGIKQSDAEAEKYWLLAASKDNLRSGCIKAQSTLGMFYARYGERNYDIEKSHFWHQEATGGGSVESQGALGVMYEHGLGVDKNLETSFKCFKSAAERGNVYAMGNLAVHYYRRKLFINAADVSKRVGSLQDIDLLVLQTGCLEAYIRKGIALGSFIYGRCVHQGLACPKNEKEAEKWYTRAAEFDLNTVAKLQKEMTYGYI